VRILLFLEESVAGKYAEVTRILGICMCMLGMVGRGCKEVVILQLTTASTSLCPK
jgi:hypothetical protein